ncbi:hypothetical protein ABL78_6825 [Leptomonas seymouri]|uniref:Uncharacterized protein n=1 Tax=Leptomonas seymouri TaxID=5684 RepID=A0A0N0P3W5_LEPSE|nr:hypothetical protein ABL78_6825 [Leptomonas seymouri]|eukprot:KPI84127.1 hypothetical protein ABL78_6825 [Leptomonas seymouri]
MGSAEAAGTPAATTRAKADTLARSDVSSTNRVTESSAGSGGGIAAEDQARLNKFGVLLVNVGAASEEAVFGAKDSAAMLAYRHQEMSDLLVINRRQDDAAAHPFQWYKPWTWWRSGPQVSPIVRAPAGKSSARGAPSSSAAAASMAVGATQTHGADLPLPPAAEQHVKQRKKGLPTVDMRPLTDSEVAALTPVVQEERAKVLKTEEHLHKALQNVEDMRHRYLVPSLDVHCEAEVAEVVRCYVKRHQATAGAVKAIDSASISSVEVPAVRADLLACGPMVQQLKACAGAMAMAYSHDSEVG